MADTIQVPLTRGMFATVDAADADAVLAHNWWANCSGSGLVWYAATRIDGVFCRMHRWLLNAPRSAVVDHRDGNGLHNVRDNLRLATVSQNQMNCYRPHGSSKFKGVSWCANAGRWRVCIMKNRVMYQLGLYDNEVDAALAYDAKARELHGTFARLNFPDLQVA